MLRPRLRGRSNVRSALARELESVSLNSLRPLKRQRRDVGGRGSIARCRRQPHHSPDCRGDLQRIGLVATSSRVLDGGLDVAGRNIQRDCPQLAPCICQSPLVETCVLLEAQLAVAPLNLAPARCKGARNKFVHGPWSIRTRSDAWTGAAIAPHPVKRR